MFNLIFVFFFALLGLIGISFHEVEEVHIAGIVFFCLSGLWLFASTCNCFFYYSEQEHKFQNLRASLKKMNILKEKSEKIIAEFKLYLGDKYPELEKQIFSDISNAAKGSDKWGMFIIKYPKIQSSKTFTYLVSEIDSLMKDIYKLRLEMEGDCASIRYYLHNKWFIIRPRIPEDISDVVNSPLPTKE